MIPEYDEFEPNQDTKYLPETSRYLEKIESDLYLEIQKSERVNQGLLFIGCQFTSCSLSWFLFDLQVTLSMIQMISMVISCLPGLIDFGDSFQISVSSENWSLDLGKKPLVGIIKLGIGGVCSWNSTAQISKEVANTYTQINQSYQEIKSDENRVQVPGFLSISLICIGAIALIGILSKLQSSRKENEI